MVYKRRQKEFGNWEQLISCRPLIYANDNPGSYFLLFQLTVLIIHNIKSRKIHRMGSSEINSEIKIRAIKYIYKLYIQSLPKRNLSAFNINGIY